MAKTYKKLKDNVVEVINEVTRTETFTVNLEVLKEDIKSAEAVVAQRESELAAAEKNLQELKDLQTNVNQAK